MASPSPKPVSPLVAVRSLEDDEEEEQEDAEGGYGDEGEMCEVVAVHAGCPFKPGQVVWVRPEAFHHAVRIDDALYVDSVSIIAVAEED